MTKATCCRTCHRSSGMCGCACLHRTMADVIQEVGPELRDEFLFLLDEPTRREVTALLAYKEDDAGGLMNPRFARLRPESTVDEAISYLRKEAPTVDHINYAYVLDQEQHLLGVVSLRLLFSSDPNK